MISRCAISWALRCAVKELMDTTHKASQPVDMKAHTQDKKIRHKIYIFMG